MNTSAPAPIDDGMAGEARSTHRLAISTGAQAVGASAAGSFAIGALAVGALAIGALAIGRLVIGRARIRRLECSCRRIGSRTGRPVGGCA